MTANGFFVFAYSCQYTVAMVMAMTSLVENVLQIWCSRGRRRTVFDEYLRVQLQAFGMNENETVSMNGINDPSDGSGLESGNCFCV